MFAPNRKKEKKKKKGAVPEGSTKKVASLATALGAKRSRAMMVRNTRQRLLVAEMAMTMEVKNVAITLVIRHNQTNSGGTF